MEPTVNEDKAIESLSIVAAEISAMSDCRGLFRRQYCDLARRVKLLSPLFDEMKDVIEVGEGVGDFGMLLNALVSAKELLRSVNEDSKLYQALQREAYAVKFQKVTEDIENALGRISYDKLDIPEEVREQVELVHAQFRRAKEKADLPDPQLLTDLSVALIGKYSNPIILKRLSEKLQLRTINDLKMEALALREMVISTDEDPGDYRREMSLLLKKLEVCVLMGTPVPKNPESNTSTVKYRSPVIPDDFRCPISLELMRDPVIVSTGQTYERSCIHKWLDSGHKTCPKTQQNLSHTALTPNFVLKSLIAQWCEANGIEPPKKQVHYQGKRTGNRPDSDPAAINSLLQKLERGTQEEQRAAAGELRLLAKRNADNRICIAAAGAIPLLIKLLSSSDPRTQEHAVTALLNLSINEDNKSSIVNSNAIPKIVEVLKNGSMEARENAAATLFSLSVIDGNKVLIGAAGAIPALIDLLCEGSPRGKKDAATAIFNLAIYQGNKVKTVRAGIVVHLMRLLVDPSGEMMDEALAILAILASHQEGRLAIAESDAIPVLIEVVRTASPRNKENATVVLWSLCANDVIQLRAAREMGAEEALAELAEGGTDRAKRKATGLLELIHHSVEA